MTRLDIINYVSKALNLSTKESEIIVNSTFDSIIRSLRAGDKVEIRRFGSFKTRQRNARKGHNPKTLTTVDVPSKKVAYFKASRELKELINGLKNA